MRYYVIILSLLASLVCKAQTISREEAISDIDSLYYTLSEVHPDMYANIGVGELAKAIRKVKDGLPESMSITELYRRMAPSVSLIGDAHTGINMPYREIMVEAKLFMPVYPTIDSNTGKMYVKASVANRVPYDSEIVYINGVPAADMVKEMERYASGERSFYRLGMVDNNIMGLFHMLYASGRYKVAYKEPKSRKVTTIELDAVNSTAFQTGLVLSPRLLKLMERQQSMAAYSFRLVKEKRTAVMEFNSCVDSDYMATFADSMLVRLKEEGITTLIIDVRNNGGGNSRVGDELLRRISPEPFCQYGQTYVRITPTTLALSGNKALAPGIYFYPEGNTYEPLPAEGRFAGKVFLLTSHNTFSSAASFAWAFKQFGCGTVVGEETGGMNVHFGDVLTYTLPHSKLTCNISHKRFWQYGADEGAIHGLIPDITTDKDDALDHVLKMIK